MRWSAVFAGAAFAVGLWALLPTLGMGLGLSAVSDENPESLRAAGIGTGVWSLIAPLIAIFAGGLLAGRLASTRSRGVAMLHGAVMWALATIVGLWAVTSMIASVVSGVARVGGAAAAATSTMVVQTAQAGAANADTVMAKLGIDTNDLLAPINQRLQREGKPAITERQLTATIRGVVERGLRQGRVDRQLLVDELARNTNLSTADARDIAAELEAKYGDLGTELQQDMNELQDKATTGALRAVDTAGKTLAFVGLMMVLSLAAGVGGAALGLGRRERPDAIDTSTTTSISPTT